jgi:class 3 adenylate cyclase
MTNTSQTSFSHPLHDFYSRSFAFIAIALTLAFAQYLGLWQENNKAMILTAIAYPALALLIHRYTPTKYQKICRPLLFTLDGALVGFLMAHMQFAVLPCILFFIMANTSSIALGKPGIWLASLLATSLGAYIGTLIFDSKLTPQAPLYIELCAAIGVTIHLGVSGFYSGKQTNSLENLHLELRQQEQEQKDLANKVSKYISPQVLESIFSGKQEVTLETQRKKLVVFFSDIKGFTSLSEQIESEVLTDLLNNYLTEMTNIALKYGGTIDKYIGDSIMVFFGDPKTQGAKKDTLACVAMAIEMRKHMKVLRQKWRAQGVKTPLEIRMGINTGYCTVGNFGTESRMDYTIIGKEVNMASRLEAAAEAGEILLSYESYALIQDKIICREKGHIKAKGFSRPVPVYQVVDFRHNLAAKTSFVEHELPGFSMYMDTNRINNYDRDKIAAALERAAIKIKSQSRMQG